MKSLTAVSVPLSPQLLQCSLPAERATHAGRVEELPATFESTIVDCGNSVQPSSCGTAQFSSRLAQYRRNAVTPPGTY